jgi:sterol desaturase/sphingolipid hydroxylase (fatty acid hydroxylase superfamily)
MHRVKRLWMFHLVHHSDAVVDVSTTLREHPGENFIRLCFTLVWVFLSGTLFWVLLLRQTIQVITTLFAHMNYELPEKIDTIIGLVFITPNLHHVHHHYKQPYTDCNYGDVFSIWDRLFGTFKTLPQKELIYGVDTYMEKEDNSRFTSLIKIPFGKYRSNKNIAN